MYANIGYKMCVQSVSTYQVRIGDCYMDWFRVRVDDLSADGRILVDETFGSRGANYGRITVHRFHVDR